MCYNSHSCNGYIDCPWLTPNDEANCSSQCPFFLFFKPCDCNKPGNMECKEQRMICYNNLGKALAYFLTCLSRAALDILLCA